jgi:hypothetical protein
MATVQVYKQPCPIMTERMNALPFDCALIYEREALRLGYEVYGNPDAAGDLAWSVWHTDVTLAAPLPQEEAA